MQPNGSRMPGALKNPKFGLRTFWVDGVALEGPGFKWFWAEADGCCGLDGSILQKAFGVSGLGGFRVAWAPSRKMIPSTVAK